MSFFILWAVINVLFAAAVAWAFRRGNSVRVLAVFTPMIAPTVYWAAEMVLGYTTVLFIISWVLAILGLILTMLIRRRADFDAMLGGFAMLSYLMLAVIVLISLIWSFATSDSNSSDPQDANIASESESDNDENRGGLTLEERVAALEGNVAALQAWVNSVDPEGDGLDDDFASREELENVEAVLMAIFGRDGEEFDDIANRVEDLPSFQAYLNDALQNLDIPQWTEDEIRALVANEWRGQGLQPHQLPGTAAGQFGPPACTYLNAEGLKGAALKAHLENMPWNDDRVIRCRAELLDTMMAWDYAAAADLAIYVGVAEAMGYGNLSQAELADVFQSDSNVMMEAYEQVKAAHNAYIEAFANDQVSLPPGGATCFMDVEVQVRYRTGDGNTIAWTAPRTAVCEEEINLVTRYINPVTGGVVTAHNRVHCFFQITKVPRVDTPPATKLEETTTTTTVANTTSSTATPTTVATTTTVREQQPRLDGDSFCNEADGRQYLSVKTVPANTHVNYWVVNGQRVRGFQSYPGNSTATIKVTAHWAAGGSATVHILLKGNCVADDKDTGRQADNDPVDTSNQNPNQQADSSPPSSSSLPPQVGTPGGGSTDPDDPNPLPRGGDAGTSSPSTQPNTQTATTYGAPPGF